MDTTGSIGSKELNDTSKIMDLLGLQIRSVSFLKTDDLQTIREKLARVIIDEMFQFIALLDTNGNLLEVNRAALDGGGIVFEDIYQKPFWEAHWWTISRKTQTQLKRAIKKASQGEFIRYDVDVFGSALGKESITIDFSLLPIRDSSGNVVFLLPEGRNISEMVSARRLIEEKNNELQTMLQKVQELDQLKNQFFSNVSHELRTPLTLILGPTEKLINEGDYLSAMHKNDLGLIRRNSVMLLKQVNDLLEISKFSANKTYLSYTRSDFSKLIRLICSNFECISASRKIALDVHVPVELYIEIDSEKMERVLLNLLSNAFKFTPNGGLVQVKLSIEKNTALLRVKDSGPGIPEQSLQKIFERFVQADGKATRIAGGTGLGLAIAKEIVKLHHGNLSVACPKEGGSCFTVELPLFAPKGSSIIQEHQKQDDSLHSRTIQGTIEELKIDSASVKTQEHTPEHGLSVAPKVKRTILIAEDNPDMNSFIVECLEDDFHVISTQNGAQCLKQLLIEKPDLIITDIMMPQMSGEQLIYEVRQNKCFDDISIIILSAKADDEMKVRLLREGAQDYCVKPFSKEELKSRAMTLIRLKLANQSLVEMNHKLTQSNIFLEQFASSAAHDLKEPLRSITCFTEMLKDDYYGKLSSEADEYIDFIVSGGRRMNSLIDGLLKLARLKEDTLNKVAHDAKTICNIALINLKSLINSTATEIICSLEGTLYGDESQLTQLFQNLIYNAIKYSKKGIHPKIKISSDGSQSDLQVILVKDNGIGIEEKFHKEIFNMFKRLHTSKDYEGSGIGLALCQRIVELHGGKIWVESVVNEGSTFSFSLPKKD